MVLVQKGFLPGKDQEREGFGKRVKSTEDGIRASSHGVGAPWRVLGRPSATGFGRWGSRKSRLTCPSRGRRGSLYVGRAPRRGGGSSSHRRSTSSWRRTPPSMAPVRALRWRQTRRAGRRGSDFLMSSRPSSSASRRRASRTTSVLVDPSLFSSVSRYARSASVSRKAVSLALATVRYV